MRRSGDIVDYSRRASAEMELARSAAKAAAADAHARLSALCFEQVETLKAGRVDGTPA